MEDNFMKTNSAANRESLGIVDTKVNRNSLGGTAVNKDDKSNSAEAGKSQNQGTDAVNVQVSKSLLDHLSLDEMANERASKIAEIRKQVQSGEYFSSRSVTDIAQILERRMGEEIEITKIFTKDEEE
jgi:anti-sigma28 factor (negative regulator of flagellin synthesis)